MPAPTVIYRQFSVSAPVDWEEALTMVLYAHGAPGLEVEDPALIAAHLSAGDWDASVFDGQTIETGYIVLRALFPADMPLEKLYEDIAALDPKHGNLFDISTAALPERDWQQVWRESFPTLRLARSLVVMPYWRKENVQPQETALFISPGQAFGTGDHVTTALMVELLEDYLQPGAKVLDLGCGSGILAIAALKLGAIKALAVDKDLLCADSITEHRLLNGLTEDALPFLPGDILQDMFVQNACHDFTPDLLLSNIVAEVVIKLAATATAFLASGCLWICGGILCEKEPQVQQAFAVFNWQILKRCERDGWLAFCCGRDEQRHE